jgi:phage shock protein A
MSAGISPQQEAQARATLQRMRSDLQAMMSKIAELESQKDEHECAFFPVF